MENMLCNHVGWVSYSLFVWCSAVGFMPWRTTPISVAFPSSLSPLGVQLLRPSPSHSCCEGGGAGRGGGGVGEYSLKKSWLRATAVSCPSLSSPVVHSEYSIHQKMVVNYASLPWWINDENSHTKSRVLGSYCSEDFCLSGVLEETCHAFSINSRPTMFHMGWCACKQSWKIKKSPRRQKFLFPTEYTAPETPHQ